MRTFSRLLKIMMKFWDRLALAFTGTVIEGLCNGVFAYILAKIIDICSRMTGILIDKKPIEYVFYLHQLNVTFLNYTAHGRKEVFQLIMVMAIIVIGINLVKGFFAYGKNYGYSSLIHKTLMALRNLIYGRIVWMDVPFFDANKTGDLTAKITNDVDNLRIALFNLLSIIFDALQGILYFIILFGMNWQLTLAAIIIFPPTILLVRRFSQPIRKANTQVVENISRMTSFLGETLQGIRIIKIFTKEKDEQERFQKLTKENYSANMKGERLSAYQKPLNDIFSTTGFMIVVLFLSQQILSGGQTIGSVAGYLVLLNLAYKPLKSLSGFNDALQRILASIERIFGLTDLKDEKIGDKGAPLPNPIIGNMEFRDVSFEYHQGHATLKNISCSVSAGKTLAIVGPSGSGKTTLVSLIPLFYRNYIGTILLDGVSIHDIGLTELRRNIAIVPQDTFLFSGTVRENIRYGCLDSCDEDIVIAAKNANAHDFIIKLKDGYDSEIGERGVKLSGGEKQRISIARALLKNPRILILDEATSALDTQSELLVQQALSFLMKNRTTFVIAHRLSTIRKADHIVVLEDGRLVEEGNHEALYAKDGLYRKLCEIQFEMNE